MGEPMTRGETGEMARKLQHASGCQDCRARWPMVPGTLAMTWREDGHVAFEVLATGRVERIGDDILPAGVLETFGLGDVRDVLARATEASERNADLEPRGVFGGPAQDRTAAPEASRSAERSAFARLREHIAWATNALAYKPKLGFAEPDVIGALVRLQQAKHCLDELTEAFA